MKNPNKIKQCLEVTLIGIPERKDMNGNEIISFSVLLRG
jgi:hypothetical protein